MAGSRRYPQATPQRCSIVLFSLPLDQQRQHKSKISSPYDYDLHQLEGLDVWLIRDPALQEGFREPPQPTCSPYNAEIGRAQIACAVL